MMRTPNRKQSYPSGKDPRDNQLVITTFVQYLLILVLVGEKLGLGIDWFLSLSIWGKIGLGLGLYMVGWISSVGINRIFTETFSLQLLKRLGSRGIKLLIIVLYMVGGLLGYLFIHDVILPRLPEVWQAGVRLYGLLGIGIAVEGVLLAYWSSLLLSIDLTVLGRSREDISAEGSLLKQKALEVLSQDDNRWALALYQRALQLFRSIGYERAVIATHLSIARTAMRANDSDQAAKHAPIALRMSQIGGHRDLQIDALAAMGELFHYQHDLQQAMVYHQQVINLAREIGRLEYVTGTLGYMANAYYQQKELEKVLACYEQAEEARQALKARGADINLGQLRAISTSFLGGRIVALVELERLEEAEQLCLDDLRRIELDRQDILSFGLNKLPLSELRMLQAAWGLQPNDSQVLQAKLRQHEANAINNLGIIEQHRGDRCAELGQDELAQAAYTRAEELYRQALELSDRDRSTDWMNPAYNLAMLAGRRGDFRLAESLYNELVTITRSKKFNMALAATLTHRGQIYLKQGDYTRAAQDLAEATKLAESIRIGLQREPEHRLGFQQKWVVSYQLGVQAFWGNQQMVKAFETLELAKSRTFVELLRDTPLRAPATLERRMIEKEEILRQQIDRQARALALPQDSAPEFERQMKKFQGYLEELRELYGVMAETAPDYVAMRGGTTLSYDAIRHELP